MTCPKPGAREHAPPGIDRLLAGLTPEQAQAVTHRQRPAAVAGRPGRRQDQNADPPRRVSDRERPRAAVGDPRGHVQRPRRRRAAAAARRPARRDRRARGDRGDVSLGVRPAAARARRRVRAHRALHDLRPGGHAPGDRLAAVRRRARRDPAGAGRLRPARQRRGAGRDLARQEPAAVSRDLRAIGVAPRRSVDRRAVARERDRAAAQQRVGLRRSARVRGAVAGRGAAPAGVASPAVAVDHRATSSRTPAMRRRRWSTCSPARTGTCACAATTTS